jgi:hypothetical protein
MLDLRRVRCRVEMDVSYRKPHCCVSNIEPSRSTASVLAGKMACNDKTVHEIR